MQKPAGMTAASSLLAFVALFGTLGTIALFQADARQPAGATSHSAQIEMTAFAVVFALTTAYCWCVVVGLSRFRNWARMGGIIIGALMIIFSLLVLLISLAVLLLPSMRSHFTYPHGALVANAVGCVLLLLGGSWLTFYFNRNSVKQGFRNSLDI